MCFCYENPTDIFLIVMECSSWNDDVRCIDMVLIILLERFVAQYIVCKDMDRKMVGICELLFTSVSLVFRR